ncbi:MAG: ATP-binding cassette domain-containing protein [Chloroherpetonaceae bacterium]|nr:ATP-binding cassette domain-containing protein [Chloroherpetonaceae bacterium]MDW8438192.1 ATP-binding cassette domain-containing protein [Chloroherpetonaceae bacterium]
MIAIENASKIFAKGTPNEVHALKNVSLRIEKGDFITVIGTNGSGKSTLLNAIAGTLALDSGRIKINNLDVTKLPDFKRAKYIGRVFQNPFSGTAPTMTVAENLQLAYLRGERKTLTIAMTSAQKKFLRERVAELRMGLENRMDTPIGLLSGGQRQALTLLMAAFKKPEILLLDEHTAALDPISAELVLAITQEIVSKYQLTALMVTHSMSYATRFGNRLIMMNLGEIACDIQGEEKRNLTEQSLLKRFEERHIHVVI